MTIDLPEEESRVVAVSHFTPGGLFQVQLSFSQPVYEQGNPQMPEKAEVTLSSGGRFLEKLYKSEDGKYWIGRKAVKENTEYALAVRVPGMPLVHAESYTPHHVALKPIQVEASGITVVSLANGKKGMRVPVEIFPASLPEENRYFAFDIRHEIVQSNGNGSYTTRVEHSFFLADGRTLSLLHDIPEPVVLINDKFWDDNRLALYLDVLIPFEKETEKPRRIFLEWRTLSSDFYKYHLSLARQGGGPDIPLNDPDAVFNNVENGYGNFSGYSVSVDTIILPE